MAAQLMVEDVPAVELAERFGTPLFAISENSIRERYRRTLAAVRAVYDPVEVYYAVKSNPILGRAADPGHGGRRRRRLRARRGRDLAARRRARREARHERPGQDARSGSSSP